MVYRNVAVLSALLLVWPVVGADAAGEPAVAALQVALLRAGVYEGAVDGVDGPLTLAAVRLLQARNGLPVDGVVGPRTRRVLGPYARHRPGTNVSEAQFELAWAGYPSGALDGCFGPHAAGAVRRFQRARRLPPDGVFGPRGDAFHADIDLLARAGTPVKAAAAGRVVWSGRRAAWGILVTIAHGGGIRTLYAHLEKADAQVGEPVTAGTVVGRVGATGDATGPHLRFEARFRGAAVDPLPVLGDRPRLEMHSR